MDRIDVVLSKFGLSEAEIKVYRACLSGDTHSPFTISKATGIPRTTVYDVLMSLSLKGLVELQQSDGFTKQQTKVTAKNPSSLRTILQEKRKELVGLETDIVGILPFLKEDYHAHEGNSDFRFYPGVEGFRKLYSDRSYEEIDAPRFTWDVLMPMDVVGSKLMNKLVKAQLDYESKGKQYPPKELVSLNDWTRHVLSYQYGRDNRYLLTRNIRYIEDPAFSLNVEINIIGTHIRIFSSHENEVWGLEIVSKSLSSTLSSIFLLQWMSSTDVTPELVKSWGPNEMLEYEKMQNS